MNMQTGFGDGCDGMIEQYIQTMTNILLPVMERSTLLAANIPKPVEEIHFSQKIWNMR